MSKYNGPINKKYFIAPFIIGILPSILCGVTWLISGALIEGAPNVIEEIFGAIFLFIMFYSSLPAVIVRLFGFEILSSPSGSMISLPNTAISWVVVMGFYIIFGIIVNNIFMIRLRKFNSQIS